MIVANKAVRVNGIAAKTRPATPPHNRDAERALLGTMLRDPGIISEVAELVRLQHFYVYGHQAIYAAIVALGRQADLVTVAERLTAANKIDDAGGACYLAELWDNAPTAAQYRSYAESIRQHAARRQLVHLADDVSNRASDLGDLPDDIIQSFVSRLKEIEAPRTATPQLIARPASEFATAHVDWLWPGRIPLGALTILDGDPGLGKSTVMLDLAARVSRGFEMPGEEFGHAPASVVILSAEDDPARTIRPRLEAANADLERVQIVEAMSTGNDGDRLPVLPYDLAALEQFIANNYARLVIIDPLMAYLGDGIDSHKDQEIRSALRQFAKLAERTQCSIVIIRHLNKMNGANALYRGGGSIGIIGAARSGLLLARHPDRPHTRVLASTKSNLGPQPRSIVLSLENVGSVAVAAWGEEIEMSADDLIGQAAVRRTKVDDCAEAIKEILADGKPMKSADLDAELKRRGYSASGIRRGRKAADVKPTKSSFDGEWYVTVAQGAQAVQDNES